MNSVASRIWHSVLAFILAFSPTHLYRCVLYYSKNRSVSLTAQLCSTVFLAAQPDVLTDGEVHYSRNGLMRVAWGFEILKIRSWWNDVIGTSSARMNYNEY